MNILAAFDKFKDSMSAAEACKSAAIGIVAAYPDQPTSVTLTPLTDGGEGFVDILTQVANGHIEFHTVSGPRSEEVSAPLGWVECENLPTVVKSMLPIPGDRIAIIEMAAVSGLEMVPFEARHPRHCTSYGVGELIRIAQAQGASAILIGIGGSATSDLGVGALEALGLHACANNGQRIEKMTPEHWPFFKNFTSQLLQPIPPIYIACDVGNPLLGTEGAAAIYGPQKGLLAEEIEAYDQMCGQMADHLCDFFQHPRTVQTLAGSGAAGGIGFGLHLGCQAQLVPGFPLVAAWLELDARIQQADLILTGEGKFDQSSLDGKGPYALIQSADKHGKQALLFAGKIDPDAADKVQLRHTNCALYSISPDGDPLEKALFEAPGNLQHKVTEMIQHCYPI